jgi:Fe-S cluster biogenesis protein NfuA
VRLVDFDGRRLRVEMGGACAGCHLSATTLQGWVAGTVRQFFPDLEKIELA